MGIPQAIPSVVPQVIFFIASQFSWERASIGCSTLEGGFYHLIKGGNLQANSVVRQISETFITRIHEIQALFNIANVGISSFYAQKLLTEIHVKFSFSIFDKVGKNIGGFYLACIIAGTAFIIQRYLHNQSNNTPSIQDQKSSVEVIENQTIQQKIGASLHVTKLILNLALFCFAKNRLLLGFDLIGSGYSFWKNTKLKWISFSKTFPLNLNSVTQAKVTYNMLVVPLGDSNTKEKCSICLDPQMDMVFCTNHLFHQRCMKDFVHEGSDKFLKVCKILRTETRHYDKSMYTHSTYDYSVTIPEDNLPSCPMCRDIPLQNWCDIEITDRYYGIFNAWVNIKRPSINYQPLFEKLYTIYNIAQVGLSFLLKYPELTMIIFKIQQVLLVTDFIGYSLTLHYLYNKLEEKFKIKNSIGVALSKILDFLLEYNFNGLLSLDTRNSVRIALSPALGAITTVLLSYFAILKINPYIKPALFVGDFLSQLPPEISKCIEMNWVSPFPQQLIQCLYINRIVALVALSFFSKQQMLNCLSITAQLLSLSGISRLKWIEFIQTIEYPLEKIVAARGSLTKYLNTSTIQTLKLRALFLIDPSCTTELAHFQSVATSIYNYMNNILLDKSHWHGYWRVSYRNGFEVGRSLIFKVTLQNNPITSCACRIIPTMINLSMSAVSSFYHGSVALVKFKGIQLPPLFLI